MRNAIHVVRNPVLRTTARKLTTHNIKQRSMLQVAASFSDVVSVVAERKALRSLRDTEVDGENTKHPTVKRLKHPVPDRVVRVTGVYRPGSCRSVSKWK
jgi:hypothetical protein